MKNLFKRPKAAGEATKYYWDKYTAPDVTHSIWNKYNVNTPNIYSWNSYNLRSTTGTQYIWNKYDTTTIQRNLYAQFKYAYRDVSNFYYPYIHHWNKYELSGVSNPYYSWTKNHPQYMWNKYTKVQTGSGDNYVIDSVINRYSPQGIVIGHDSYGGRIIQYDVDDEIGNFFPQGFTFVDQDSDDDSSQDWYVSVRFCSSYSVDQTTGAIVYENPFMYNGQVFKATYHFCRMYYNAQTGNFLNIENVDKPFAEAPDQSLFYYTTIDTTDATTQYVFENNLIDLDTYCYMDIMPYCINNPNYSVYYYLNKAIVKTLNNESMQYQNYITPNSWIFSGMKMSYENRVALGWMFTNVETQGIIDNRNPSGYRRGDFIESVYSSSPNAYPQDGESGDYWYVAVGVTKGDFIETVTSTNSSAYPENAMQDDYWYSDKTYHAAGEHIGELVGQVWGIYKSSDGQHPYPDDGGYNGYYYRYTGKTIKPQAKTDVTYYPAYTNKDWDFISQHNFLEIHVGDTISFASNWEQYNAYYPSLYGDGEQNELEGQYMWAPPIGSEYKTVTVTASNIDTIWSGNYDTPYGESTGDPYDYHAFIINATIPESGFFTGKPTGEVVYYQFSSVYRTGHQDGQGGFIYSDEDTPQSATEVHNGHHIRTSLLKYTYTPELPPFYNTYLYTLNNYFGLWYQIDNTLSPNNGWKQDLIYSLDGYIEAQNLLGEVRSSNRNAYPDDGILNGYYYSYQNSETGTIYTKNTPLGTVTSNSISTYPQDGIMGNRWYTYTGYRTTTTKGSLIGKVSDTYAQTYPVDGILNGYWYTRTATDITQPMKGQYLETIYSSDSSAYPTDGEYNGYWYVAWLDEDYPAWNDHNILSGVTYRQNINPDADYIIGAVAAASVEFSSTLDFTENMTTTEFKYFNNQNQSTEMTQLGIFNITSRELQSNGGYKIIGYDNISKFDVYCDELIDAITFPLTLKQFFIRVCQNCGAPYNADTLLVNDSYLVNDNFEGTNITGRQLLGYIAEAAGGYIYCNSVGQVCVGYYNSKATTLDNTKYVTYFTNDYLTQKIGKLVIQMTTDDVGTIATNPAGVAQYNITNNPLFYNDSPADNQEAADRILSKMVNVQYTPSTITLLEDFNINCGDIITVDGNTVYVMEKVISPSGVTLNCFGNKERQTEGSSINSEIVALRGKSNELTRTIEETRSLITDTTNGLQTQLKQTADSFNLQISKLNNIVSEIKADVSGISLSYNSSTGKASIRIGDVIVNDLVNDDYVERAVAGVELDGYVRFNDLSTAGSTVINGSNITTGMISADRINLTGSIQWNDLANSTKNTISNMASSGSVPDYIHSTYIDEVTIYSPTIYGATITAGSSAKGYVEMSSSGMSFCSNTGGALIGLGFYAGNYKYPYITLGQGIDEFGTNRGMIKKYTNGLWIGDSDSITSSTVGSGTGLFVNFVDNKIYKYENGVATQL